MSVSDPTWWNAAPGELRSDWQQRPCREDELCPQCGGDPDECRCGRPSPWALPADEPGVATVTVDAPDLCATLAALVERANTQSSTCVLVNEGLDAFLALYPPPARRSDAEEFADGMERATTRATAYLARRGETMSDALGIEFPETPEGEE